VQIRQEPASVFVARALLYASIVMRTPPLFLGFGFSLLALAGATACTQSASGSSDGGGGFEGGGPTPDTIVIAPSSTTDVAKAAVATTTYQWDNFPSNIAVQDKLCIVSGFYGKFEHMNHQFQLSNGGANYYLWQDAMHRGENGAGRGSITCVRHSSFLPGTDGVRWLGGPFTSIVDVDLWGREDSGMWWGDGMSFVSGIRGEFAGGGEHVKVFQSTSATSSSIIQANTQASELHGYGSSYFVGVPSSGKLVKLYGYRNGSWVRGNVSSSGLYEYDVGTTAGYSSYWLPPRDKAFCFITRVSGNFDGGGERLQITVNGDQWFVKAQAAGGKFVSGAVRCMAYDQRG
jgi:hypothetical protein